MRLQLLSAALLLICIACSSVAAADPDTTADVKRLQDKLLCKDCYNTRHRPVKADATQLVVVVQIGFTHIEKVNEDEQTAVLHGTMWATWRDEYLVWKPEEYNGLTSMFVPTYNIWQPALSLYNSARGNQWNLYWGAAPASVDSNGTVAMHGSFSFYVTCQFDFAAWPNDQHYCPVVLADWVYDMSRVNLTTEYAGLDLKPYVSLHNDPFGTREKKHVAGWEVTDLHNKTCYWGPKWCQQQMDNGTTAESYWSVLEFGVTIRRHAPYIVFTLVIPTILSSSLTLFSFWIEHDYYPLMLLVFNAIFQGLYGWDMIRQLPPGNGTIPDMIFYYGFNLSLTILAIIFHIFVDVIPSGLPKALEIPVSVTELASQLKSVTFFKTKGFSFDPQALYGDLSEGGEGKGASDLLAPSTTLATSASAALLSGLLDGTEEKSDVVLQMAESAEKPGCSTDNVALVEVTQAAVSVTIEGPEGQEKKGAAEGGEQEAPAPLSLTDHAQLVRRLLFCLFALAYLWELPRAFF